ncbi:hypothetical protein [Chryseobacterium sp. BIGb0232]|uniref:hypothetical protein n=1 Tax=Chryseobacterium sp. BIGb0232 TaxID=2940598 RepID=UPI000F47B9FD|nr:hypothetical protein [Chryseobacterium sp. BIGb0232]MCS4301036.1 hypothetical protein [Chryseobacterium sp. BIGb0232]ROS20099.1 hypothetical protein EDF65_0801 [Chryseobacterium nakagawai]
MSNFDETLVLLKEKKDPKSFIMDFNEKLRSVDVLLEKDEDEIIVFNDTRHEEEKDYVELDESMTEEQVIDLICSWKALGLLSYRHPDFRLQIGINYLTWDDQSLHGFEISFSDKDLAFDGTDRQTELILKISQLIDYEYIVGDVGHASRNYISMEESLEKIKEHIMSNSFTIDSRTW